jgi:hypothetical protein
LYVNFFQIVLFRALLILFQVAQAGIAAIALTYGFEVDEELVLHLDNGQVTTANMSYVSQLLGAIFVITCWFRSFGTATPGSSEYFGAHEIP